jgi:hypothetical protein
MTIHETFGGESSARPPARTQARSRWWRRLRRQRTTPIGATDLPSTTATTAAHPSRLQRLRVAANRPIVYQLGHAVASGAIMVRSGAMTIADVVAPESVDRSATDWIRVGDSFLQTLQIVAFPPTLSLGWLHDPALGLDLPGVTVHQCIIPVPDGVARTILNRSEKAAITTMTGDELSGTSADVDAEQGGQAAAELRRDLAAGRDRMMQVAITITINAPVLDELRARVEALRTAAAQMGIGLSPLRGLQWEGYISSLPLAQMPDLVMADFSGKAAAMGLPVSTTGIEARGGRPVIWGRHSSTDAPILFDRWKRKNPHAVVIAESGSGKTYALSGQIAQDVVLGEDAVLVLDPKNQEYRNIVQGLGGVYVSLSSRSGYHINPLELPTLTVERRRNVVDLEEDLLGQRIAFVKALVVQEFRDMGTKVTGFGSSKIEQAINLAYSERNISSDPATFTGEMPTLSDVERHFGVLTNAEANDPELLGILRAFPHFTSGTLGDLFNHASNIPVGTPLLGLDLWSLLSSNDEVLQRLVPVIVMDFFVTIALNRPTGRRSHLILDEAHALLQSEAGAKTLEMVYRIGRSLGFMATVITQSLNDLTKTTYARILLENAETKLVMGLNKDSDAVRRAAELLHLNEQEEAWLAQCGYRPGEGSTALLMVGGERSPLMIPPWPATLHHIIVNGASV